MPSYPEFSDRVVAVTGAAQGIGAVTARAFAEQHASVALLDIDEARAKKVGGEITAAGGRALVVRTDVTEDQPVAQAIASTVAEFGSAKAGVIQLTRFLAYQLGANNITANAIAPITTLTPRVAALRTEEDIERIASQVPLKRLAVPEDHAQAMLFLASDAAAYINGIVLDVNGGRVMM